jgi:hypothetical protein
MVPPVNGSIAHGIRLSSCCERPTENRPVTRLLRNLGNFLRFQVEVVIARIKIDLPLRKGRRGHARDGVGRDEERVLEHQRVDVVLEERRRGLQVEAGQRAGELQSCQYVLCVVVDRFRDLDVAATAATAEDGAKRAEVFPALAAVAGKGLPVRRQRQVEPYPAPLPTELEVGVRRGRDRLEHVRLGRIRVGRASRTESLQRQGIVGVLVPERPVSRGEEMRYFAEGAAHSPAVVPADLQPVVLIVVRHATTQRVEVKGIARLFDHHQEVVQVGAAAEILVFTVLGDRFVTPDSDGGELDHRAVEQTARRPRRLPDKGRGDDEQARGGAGTFGDTQPLRVPFDD